MSEPETTHFLFDEIQLLLAEKRTALSGMRTGIAIFALPLSVLSVLVATSRYYDAGRVLYFLIALLLLNAGLIVLGAYLILHALKRIRHFDAMIRDIKLKHSSFAEYLD